MSRFSCGQMASIWAASVRIIDSSAICSPCGFRFVASMAPIRRRSRAKEKPGAGPGLSDRVSVVIRRSGSDLASTGESGARQTEREQGQRARLRNARRGGADVAIAHEPDAQVVVDVAAARVAVAETEAPGLPA